MKKKAMLAGLILCLSVGLCACGNPLKKLPEVTDENIYNVEEETTGNEVADDILDELEDQNCIHGDVTSFVVYDRDDDEDDKDKSEVYVEVIYETDMAEYTSYFIVTCKTNDKNEWRVKEIVRDDDEEMACTPMQGPDEETIKEGLVNYVWSCYLGDTYIYFEDDNITSVSVVEEEMEELSATEVKNLVTVEFEIDEEYCVYKGSVIFDYRFVGSPENEYWYVNNYDVSEEYTVEVKEETLQELSDDRMLEDIAGYEVYFANEYRCITSDIIGSTEFGEHTFSGNNCYRDVIITLKENGPVNVTINLEVYYTYDSINGWEFNYCNYTNDGIVAVLTDDFLGNYSSVLLYNEEKVADIYYTFLELDADNNYSGYVKVVPVGESAGDIEAVEITGDFDTYYMEFYVDFDSYIYYSGYNGFSYDYLYYNPETGALDTSNYYLDYGLVKMQ